LCEHAFPNEADGSGGVVVSFYVTEGFGYKKFDMEIHGYQRNKRKDKG
jgi:hypothetical protein